MTTSKKGGALVRLVALAALGPGVASADAVQPYDARVHGGIHYRFDQKAGARQGRRVVADYVYMNQLRPVAR